jgi:hypothetical protein
MATVVKIFPAIGVATNVPVTALAPTAAVHSTSVPAGATILGSGGGIKPTAAADQQLCTVPVHINPDNSVVFFVAGAWRDGSGAMVS